MTVTELHGGKARLHLGESLAALADLETGSVDAVITDPPYSSGGALTTQRKTSTDTKYQTGTRLEKLPDFLGDTRDQRSYQYWCQLWLSECLRVTKPGGFLMQFTDWRQYAATADAIQAGGWSWRGVVVWTKPAYTVRPQKGRFTQDTEFVLWGTNGVRKQDFTSDAPVVAGTWFGNAPRGEQREHITQKPVDLMRHLMAPLAPGSTVLDPFMGSGTTGVAAITEGHEFIGVELSPYYHQVAVERVTRAITPAGEGTQDFLLSEGT